MKKILLFSLCLIFYGCSCQSNGSEYRQQSNGIITRPVTPEDAIDFNFYYIKEITYNGETHEFLIGSRGSAFGITHWPGCKHCKNK